MSRNSAMQLAAQDGPWAQLRTGTVVETSGVNAVVLVGSTTFTASVVVPFGISDPGLAAPPVGSLVAVGRQDSSWTVFGSILGVSGNLIENGSFEDTPAGSPPDGWTLYDVSGTSSALVQPVTSPVAGINVLVVEPVTTPATSIVYSSPVEVTIGDQLNLSVFVGAEYDVVTPQTADASLLALWFASELDAYPTTSSADTTVATAADVIPSPPWTPLSGTVTAPVTGFMRLGLRSVLDAGQSLYYDFATVRRIG